MQESPKPAALAVAAGISVPYASQILSGTRQPSRSLAIHILRATGWRHASIADLTADQMRVLEEVEPWTPSGRPIAKLEAIVTDEPRVIICSECDEPAPDPKVRACGNHDCPHALECAVAEPLADVELPPLTAKAPRRKKAA